MGGGVKFYGSIGNAPLRIIARFSRGVGDAAPYTQPYVGCRGEQCSPVAMGGGVKSLGRALLAPTTCGDIPWQLAAA